MSPTGSGLSNITPSHWPAEFLCTHGVFSHDDSSIYFAGEWWEPGAGLSGHTATDACR